MLLAEALDGMGKTEDAIKELESAASHFSQRTCSSLRAGYLYFKKGDYDKALPELQMEVKNNPGYAQAYLTWATSRCAPMTKRAEPLITKAMQLQKDLRLAYFDLGRIYADQNRNQEAIAAFERAASLIPLSPTLTIALRGSTPWWGKTKGG